MAEVILTKENFEAEVLNSDIPVLVDFWATWCGPCMMLSPVIAELAEELEGKVKVGKVNVDEEDELAQKFGIMSIPSIFVVKDGKIANSTVGAIPKNKILELLK